MLLTGVIHSYNLINCSILKALNVQLKNRNCGGLYVYCFYLGDKARYWFFKMLPCLGAMQESKICFR